MEESSLKFIADENISPVLVAVLNKLGDNSIKSMHRRDFSDLLGTPDEYWIPTMTKRGFICVTYDRQILVNNALLSVLASAQARMIFLTRHLANTRRWDQALWFLRHWPKIKEHATTMRDGHLVKVLKNGVIVPIEAAKRSRGA